MVMTAKKRSTILFEDVCTGLAALVIAKGPYHGRLTRVELNDDQRFSEGHYVVVIKHEGSTDKIGFPPSDVRIFYRLNDTYSSFFDSNGEGPQSLLDAYIELKRGEAQKSGALQDFELEYFDTFKEQFGHYSH